MPSARTILLWLLTLGSGLGGVLLAHTLTLPLPWLNGALLAVMGLRVAGVALPDPPGGRQLALWLIATGIALHFDSAVLASLSSQLLPVAAGVLVTLSLSLVGFWVLGRAGYDRATVFFASMPGGASEMVTMAGRFGGRDDLVTLAHTLRMTLIVLCVPALCFYFVPPVMSLPPRPPLDPHALAMVLPAGLAAVWLARRWQLPSPWVLAPLLVVAALTAGLDLHTGLPDWMRHLAQLLIGCSLGCRFNRQQLLQAPRFAALTLAVSAIAMALAVAAAWLASYWFGGSWIPWMLGIMPGGIAEMTLTADLVGQGVAFVTALQVIRLVLVMLIAESGCRLFMRGLNQSSDQPTL